MYNLKKYCLIHVVKNAQLGSTPDVFIPKIAENRNFSGPRIAETLNTKKKLGEEYKTTFNKCFAILKKANEQKRRRFDSDYLLSRIRTEFGLNPAFYRSQVKFIFLYSNVSDIYLIYNILVC